MTNAVPYHSMTSLSSNFASQFTNCCCCIPIRTGCFILGYINLIFNAFHTLVLIILTAYLGITTHGFDHVDYGDQMDDDVSMPIIQENKTILSQIGILLTVITLVNLIWVASCVACLIGLHKKKPGPIRLYVGFASARILLALAAFIYLLTSPGYSTHNIIAQSADIGLTGYFIMVYYIYAMQLEREQAMEVGPNEVAANDIAFIYPSKIDREMLVSKDKF